MNDVDGLSALVAEITELRGEVDLAVVRGCDAEAIDALRRLVVRRVVDVESILLAAGLPPFERSRTIKEGD